MLKKKIKGIYLSLSDEKISDEYIVQLVNEPKAKVIKIINQLITEKFIKEI